MPPKPKSGLFHRLPSYGDAEFSKYLRRAFLAGAGYDAADLSRPIIGIVDTSSDFNPCHRHLPEIVAAIKRGALEAGGLPLTLPTISLHEILVHPTTMFYRNLAAMETEEMISAHPLDAVVFTGGCDKTIPAQLMAAASADLPAIFVVTGPMRTGWWRGERLGACTDCRRMWAQYRAGILTEEEIGQIEQALCPTGGTCMVMGTASTMACLIEAMGLMWPGGATAPSGSGDRLRNAVTSGRAAVDLVRRNLRPSAILSPAAFHNALTVLAALGGSTNAVIHLLAAAGRARIKLSLEDFHLIAERVPRLVDLKPAGAGYMEDFHQAGGMPVLLKALASLLDLSSRSVTSRTMGELLHDLPGPAPWQKVIHPLEDPAGPAGALVVLRGSLAPEGAVIKAAAASPELFTHRGPAVVFDSPEDVARRIDDPALPVRPESVLVLRNAGPVAAGMPEAGGFPIPRRLAQAGVRDMVRISDARMSGTAFGTVVLHCSPEAAVGGPLALLRDGDLIELNLPQRRLDILLSADELEKRRRSFSPPPLPPRGWKRLHAEHVLQAHRGADLDFLLPENR